jgi:hypothetical protein
MVLIGLYDPDTLLLCATHGPYPKDQLPWDAIRMWQTIATIVISVLHDA